jgi:hypothetical protein
VPADEREVDSEIGSFMSRIPPRVKPSTWGHYPLHYVMHLVHAIEVLMYRHPDKQTKAICSNYYLNFVESFHMKPEWRMDMIDRLSEDRMAKGNVVS